MKGNTDDDYEKNKKQRRPQNQITELTQTALELGLWRPCR